MQSSGIPTRVHVAQTTRDLVPDDYVFEAREAVEVKGLGLMQTYLQPRSWLGGPISH
jgi:hypothetical protein